MNFIDWFASIIISHYRGKDEKFDAQLGQLKFWIFVYISYSTGGSRSTFGLWPNILTLLLVQLICETVADLSFASGSIFVRERNSNQPLFHNVILVGSSGSKLISSAPRKCLKCLTIQYLPPGHSKNLSSIIRNASIDTMPDNWGPAKVIFINKMLRYSAAQ